MRINNLPRTIIITNNNRCNIMCSSIKVNFNCSSSSRRRSSSIISPAYSDVPNPRLTITRATMIMSVPIPDAQCTVPFATGWMSMGFPGLVTNRTFHRQRPFATWHTPDTIRFT
jgi:hypothetical protein